jgi:hypothetical protein
MNVQATRLDQPDGGDSATQLGHVVTGELDLSHGVALYLEDITVSFDGFKALNNLTLAINAGELRYRPDVRLPMWAGGQHLSHLGSPVALRAVFGNPSNYPLTRQCARYKHHPTLVASHENSAVGYPFDFKFNKLVGHRTSSPHPREIRVVR